MHGKRISIVDTGEAPFRSDFIIDDDWPEDRQPQSEDGEATDER